MRLKVKAEEAREKVLARQIQLKMAREANSAIDKFLLSPFSAWRVRVGPNAVTIAPSPQKN